MIKEITGTRLSLSTHPLRFEQDHKDRVDVFWEQAYAANNRLWNGLFFMFTDIKIVDGILHAQGHRTDFATFLYWRDSGRDPSINHITATSFPALFDQSILAVEMSRHTANAGRIYFPAGSFDQRDLRDGYFDPVLSMRREMAEEVGVELEDDWLQGPLLSLEADGAVYVTQKASLPYHFDDIEKKWRQHQKNGGDDEVERLVQINSLRQLPNQMLEHAKLLCEYHFGSDE